MVEQSFHSTMSRFRVDWMLAAHSIPSSLAFTHTPGTRGPRGGWEFPPRSPNPALLTTLVDETRASVVVGYVTDVEGKLDLFEEYAERSLVVEMGEGGELHFAPHPDTYTPHFVYGGDCFDKGPGDLRLARMLIDFKLRYPDRVHLVIGNRDANKLKLVAHLEGPELDTPMELLPGPYWTSGTPLHVTPAQYLARAATRGSGPRPADPRVDRLKYHLNHTMGCPDSFEFRRQELEHFRAEAGDRTPVDDVDVVESYARMGNPVGAGDACLYVGLGSLAIIVGSSLFVHGGVSEASLGFVPRHDVHDGITRGASPAQSGLGVRDWVTALDAWKKEAIAEFVANPGYREGEDVLDEPQRGGSQFFAYFYRRAIHDKSVAIHATLSKGAVIPPSPAIALALSRDGIRRVVSGHKPYGDAPTIVRRHGVEFVLGDMSYSDPRAPNKRGCAVAEVVIVEGQDDSHVLLHGRLASGIEYACDTRDPWIGRMVGDWVVELSLPSGWYLLSRGRARTVMRLLVDPPALHRLSLE